MRKGKGGPGERGQGGLRGRAGVWDRDPWLAYRGSQGSLPLPPSLSRGSVMMVRHAPRAIIRKLARTLSHDAAVAEGRARWMKLIAPTERRTERTAPAR